MRKAILSVIIFLSVVIVNAQQPKDSVPNADSAIISINQVNKVLTEMKKVLTIDQLDLYNYLRDQLQLQINAAVADWRKKRKQ